MRPPSASASRSARACRFRVQSLPVSPKDTKVGQMSKLSRSLTVPLRIVFLS